MNKKWNPQGSSNSLKVQERKLSRMRLLLCSGKDHQCGLSLCSCTNQPKAAGVRRTPSMKQAKSSSVRLEPLLEEEPTLKLSKRSNMSVKTQRLPLLDELTTKLPDQEDYHSSDSGFVEGQSQSMCNLHLFANIG